MRWAMDRRDRLRRIERRIAMLGERATEVLAREEEAQSAIGELRNAMTAPGARVRTAWRHRKLCAAERRLERLREERAELVEAELRAIMLSLRQTAGQTRERLDRELERIAPLEQEWERLRGLFASLEDTLSTPALSELADQWQGELEIPAFPVVEKEGYIKPFPPRAILF